MIIRDGAEVLQEEALRGAASGKPYGEAEAAAFFDSLPGEDDDGESRDERCVRVSNLHWSDARLLPIMVASLRDADRYGNHGKVIEPSFFEQVLRVDGLLAEANAQS